MRAALVSELPGRLRAVGGGTGRGQDRRAGVHPTKHPQTGPAREVIARLQSILDAPAPWLAKTLGVEAKSLAKFAEEEKELDA
jgi:hypothetical protein